ncbi:cytochrome P450 oxidoreductase [Hypoxylon rubiginosum]|uniref:Cytochrome P450 oxidoreductase n=1 Tax=Hypoxylon rubiginosum TaxID=110542 RepID=A0ACB9YGU8_9PEZI|nr:cytochrome P450 oxidoreductase [Hypoxylon rubiginosum]
MAGSAHVVRTLREHWYVVLPAALLVYFLFQRYRHGLNRIPGPLIRSISPIPRLVSAFKGRSHEDDIRLHQKYGQIVRIAPNSFSISDPAEINQLYGLGTKFLKSPFYELSEAHDEEGLIPDTFILNDKELHSRMKRNAANAYSMNGLVQMEPLIEPVTERLIKKLQVYAESEKVVDIGDIIANYTMDAVFALTFANDFDYMSRGDVLGIHKVMKVASWYMAVFGQVAWSHKFLLANPIVAGWVFGDGGQSQSDMMDVANSEVQKGKTRVSEDGPMTFLQRLIFNQRDNPKSINDREVLAHAFGNITAGSDTTATAIRGVLYHLLKTPEAYQKLIKEIQHASLTLPVSFADANKVEYLGAVIKEGMRLHPSVGMMLARTVPREGAVICGYNLPGGAEVGLNPWILHRNPDVFPDPDKFWPERWLSSVTSEEQRRLMNRSFLTFGHGAHTCSGRWISMMEATKLIPTLLMCYDMELEDGGKTYRFDNFWFMMQEGLRVHLRKRTV